MKKKYKMAKQAVKVNDLEISVGDTFVNDRNGGQKITVTAVDGNPEYGNIQYKQHEAFRFSTKEIACTDAEIFVNSFRKL